MDSHKMTSPNAWGSAEGSRSSRDWETGRTRCEGPAAELILKVFGESGPDGAPSLLSAVELVWRRAGTTCRHGVRFGSSAARYPWIATFLRDCSQEPNSRQSSMFTGSRSSVMVMVFPTTSYKLEPDGWTGVVPREVDRPPSYFWRLQRNGAFIYRERIWEDDPMAITGGNLHFGAQFNLVIPAVFLTGVWPSAVDSTNQLNVDCNWTSRGSG